MTTTNPKAADLLARLARTDPSQPRRVPKVLRRSKRSQRWVEKRARDRAA